MRLVVAVSKNNVIGRDNKLPWHVPSDLAWFKLVTSGKTIAMGKNTFANTGSLPGRTTIVLDRSTKDLPEDTIIVGGACIYDAYVQHCEQLLVSRMPFETPGDAFFIVPDNFTLSASIEIGSFVLEVYTRGACGKDDA